MIAIIPARGGSKSIPRKNLRCLGQHPMIAYPIAAAAEARAIGRVIVSTDDQEIADVARSYGADVPFVRPANLAADDTPDLPVFRHALEWLRREEGYEPKIVVHLRATTPFFRVADIDRGVAMLADDSRADAVRMVCDPSQNPFKMWQINAAGFLEPLVPLSIPEPFNQPRQNLPPVYWQNGVDITRARTILELNSMTGTRILPLVSSAPDLENWIDIDTEATIQVADYLVRSGLINVGTPRLAVES